MEIFIMDLNDKEWLYNQYVILNKSKRLIAKEIHVRGQKVGLKLEEFGIKRVLQIDKEFLIDKKIKERKTINEIAKELNTNKTNVFRHLKKFNIKSKCIRKHTKISKPHKLLIKLLEEANIDHITSYILPRLPGQKSSSYEIDEYLPKLNIYLECHGIYWHRKNGKREISDIKKSITLKKYYPNIRQITIWEDELYKIDKDKLLEILKTRDSSIIQENIDNKEFVDFGNNNLQFIHSLWKDEKWLRENYIIKNLSTKEIAKIAGCNQTTINRHLKLYGIKLKPIDNKCLRTDIPIELIIELYVKNKKTMKQIGDELKINQTVIRDHLKRNSIKIRTWGEIFSKNFSKELLIQKYLIEEKSLKTIGIELNVSGVTIKRNLLKHGIKLRNYSETNLMRKKNLID
jgi:predicted DNA-binding protein YlxM (UPF0122 family)